MWIAAASFTMTINRKRHCGRRQQGFTLAEAMIAVVVLSIAAAGVLLPFSSGAVVRAEGLRRTLGARLASDLIEQIISRPFHDPDGSEYDYNPGSEAGETTSEQFDNIDDFHDYLEPQGQLKGADGTLFTDPAYTNFSRYATCEYVTVPQQPLQSEPEKCNFVLVTVQVYYSGKLIANVQRLVSE